MHMTAQGRNSISGGVINTSSILSWELMGRTLSAPRGSVEVGTCATFIMNQLAMWSPKYSPWVVSL